MRVKTCTRCGETKALDQFAPVRRSEPKRHNWCRACFAQNNARYYREHRETQKARLLRNTAIRREQNQRQAIEYLSTHPCVDCGETDVVVLQFDHLGEKRSNVSALIAGGASSSRVAEEIAKCDVRCANCHRLKTAKAWPKLVIDHVSVIAAASPTFRPIQLQLERDQLRTCRVCRENKPLSGFPLRSREKQTRQWICLECQRAYSKAWYGRNRERSIASAGKRNDSRRKIARAMVGSVRLVCIDCGETNPLLLDFDHLWDKRADVSYMVHSGLSLKTIATEVDKCAIRCANCHARKTAREQGSYRVKVS
jgi:protein-arginine kinase activator protein McsA